MTQKDVVANLLRKRGCVDNFFCIDNKITIRLGAVIHALKRDSWIFDDQKSGFIPDTKNWRYVLKEVPAPKPLFIPGVGRIPTVSTGVAAPDRRLQVGITKANQTSPC